MNHGFCIELRPEVAHETAAIFVGQAVRSFELGLDRWRRWDYEESWRRALRALAGGAPVVVLMSDVPALDGAVARGFVCERRGEQEVWVSEREFAPGAATDETGVVLAPLEGRSLREVGTTTLEAVRRFVDPSAPAGAHPAPSVPALARLDEARDAVREALRAAVQLPPSWELALSPPLPASWPLSRGMGLLSYAAATRATGPTSFQHSALLACARHDALCLAPVQTERYAVPVEPIASAHAAPLSPAELAAVRAASRLDLCFAKIAAGQPDERIPIDLRARYAFERRRAAWLSELWRPRHVELMRWLGEAPR